MKMVSAYPGLLVLPDGAEIAPGAEVDLPKDVLDNAGVKEWIDAGWLVKAASAKTAPAGDADPQA